MSNAVEQWNQPSQAVDVQREMTTRVRSLVDWAQEADAAMTLAQKLTSTAFCPQQFQGKPGDAAAAMLAGGELGLSPLTSLGAFDVIQGRASARAITLRALVQAQGHEMSVIESTTTRCRMKGRRRGANEWQTVDWTIDRAKQLGITGKDNWKKQPQAMLVARATSELARLIASDALLGIAGGYSTEELADGADEALQVTVAPSEAPAKRTMSRKPRTAPEPAPVPVEEVVEVVQMATSKQLTALNIALEERVSAERSEKLAWLENMFDRKFTSSKELTKDEASQAIDFWIGINNAEPPFESGDPA